MIQVSIINIAMMNHLIIVSHVVDVVRVTRSVIHTGKPLFQFIKWTFEISGSIKNFLSLSEL